MPLEFRGVHAEFLKDSTPEIDIEGGRNSGKTWVCCAKVVQSCLEHPGIEWLICRFSGTETDTKLRPEFVRVAHLLGVDVAWNDDEAAYWFPEKHGKVSKVFAYGLKTQNLLQLFAKIRGLGVACVWNDQTEELPEVIGTELRFAMRQPNYPHQLIFSPNPPGEDHWLADQFPDDEDLPGRKLYRLNLYQNKHNLPEQTIRQVEQMYPPTHARYKSLVLGQRGVNVIGKSIYADVFSRELHIRALKFDPTSVLLEAFDSGKHHPVWLCAQRSHFGGIMLLGGIMGKKLIFDDFEQLVSRYRSEWFGDHVTSRVCCDPPPNADSEQMRFSNNEILRLAGLKPRWDATSNNPDVREAVIQTISSYMQRRAGSQQSFLINADESRWLMASSAIVKKSKFFEDGIEGAYVWDEHFVSVGNKKVRQPKVDEWVDGAQRCLENLVLNFCATQPTQDEKDRRRAKARAQQTPSGTPSGSNGWMA